MAEYIDKEELLGIEKLLDTGVLRMSKTANTIYDQIMYDIEHMPVADVVPVKHGKWQVLDNCSNEGVYCSVCQKKVYRKSYANQKVKSSFCPNCGAKMDLE